MKTVLVTGGNKGIGLETTRLFLEEGYRVAVVARDFGSCPLVAGDNLALYPFDLTKTGDILRLVREVGPVDILVNNAGVMFSLPWDDYPQERIDYMIALNIAAPVALIREVAPGMIARGGGRIVNTASIAGHIGHPDVWYGITKAGLIDATKTFAKLLGPRGIVVNAVAPGPVETEMLAVIPEGRKAELKNATFLKRFTRPDEVAAAIYWLATDAPEYINGTCLDINNGAFPR